MTQFSDNTNIATTRHKIQGMTKCSLIVHSWSYMFHNWVYVIHLMKISSLHVMKTYFGT